jgi:hypothetical protein
MPKIHPVDPSGYFAFFIPDGSLRVAIQRCCIARIGWEWTILGPEYFITSLILAFISGR